MAACSVLGTFLVRHASELYAFDPRWSAALHFMSSKSAEQGSVGPPAASEESRRGGKRCREQKTCHSAPELVAHM